LGSSVALRPGKSLPKRGIRMLTMEYTEHTRKLAIVSGEPVNYAISAIYKKVIMVLNTVELWLVTCNLSKRVGSIGRLWYERSRIPGEQRFRAAAAARRRMGLPFPNEPTAFQILLETKADLGVGLAFGVPCRRCNVSPSSNV
jgi:hypothetical protein